MNENDGTKRYYVQLPGFERGEIWDEDKYNRNKEQLFNDHKDAIVMETSPMATDDAIGDNDMFTVHLPGFPEAEAWDAAKLGRNREQLLKEHPDVEIVRAKPVDFWGEKLNAINAEINQLKPRQESALANANDTATNMRTAFDDLDPASVVDAAKRSQEATSELFDVQGRLDTLYRERENNPAYQSEKQAKLRAFDEATARIDGMFGQLNEANPASAKIQKDPTNLFDRTHGDSKLAEDMRSNPDYYRDYEALAAAKMFYDDARKTEKAPSKYDDTTGLGNFFRGLVGEAPETLSPVALGKSIAKNTPLIKAIKDIQDAEGKDVNIVELVTQHPERMTYLSDAQKEMVTAFVVKSATDWARSEDLSLGYQSGSTAMQSLGFMADFFLMGGMGDAAAKFATKGITNGIARASVEMGLSGAKREIVQAVPKFIEGTIQAGVKTAVMTPFMPSSYSNLMDNLVRVGDSGQVDLSGKAITKAVGDVFIENLSESAGTQVEALLGVPFKLAGKAGVGELFANTKFGAWGKAVKNSPMAKIMTQAGWNGYIGEIGEEWYGNALRVMTGVDKDALKNFATVDQQIITLTSFAPMTLFGGATSTAQYIASKKQMNEAAKVLSDVLERNGYDERTIQNFIDVTKAENPTELANALAPAVVQAANDNADAPAVYKAVMDYAQAVARYRTFDGVSQADIEQQRQGMLDEISAQMNVSRPESDAETLNAPWIRQRQVDAGEGNSIQIQSVRVLTDANGDELFVVGEDEDGRLAAVHRKTGAKAFISQADIDAGIITDDTGDMSLNDFLDRELVRKRRATDAQRVELEQLQNKTELMQRTQPGTVLNIGTVENPVQGTVVQYTGGKFIVQGEDGMVHEYDEQEMANRLNLPLTPLTQEQQETADAEEIERQDKLRDRANTMVGRNIAPVIGREGDLQLVMVHRPGMSDAGLRYQVDYLENGQMTTEFFSEDQLNELIALSEQTPAVDVAEQTEPEQKDDTPRDFRGNPLPMRTNKQTGQQVVDGNALWNKDPEAWARWNDTNPNQRVGSKERLEYTITELGKEIDKDAKAVQKAALKGIDEDEMDKMESALAVKTDRRELLQSILNKYNLPATAGPTIAGEQRKAAAEQVKQEQLAGFPGIQQRWNTTPKVNGSTDEIRLPNGESIPGHYVLTEAEAPTASHNPANGFAMTEGFPVDENGKTVNDRDYEHDKAAQTSVTEKAANYDQRALQTPVIVSPDGVVLSGNDRTMAGQLAAANNTDAEYTGYLSKYAGKYGFSAEQVAQFKHPRVVFVPDAQMPYNAATFAKFNAEEKKSQSKTEKAVKAGKTLNAEALGALASLVDRYDDINALYNDKAGVDELLNILLSAEVISQEQLAALRDGDTLSGTGMDLLESTLIGAALDEEAVRIAMSDKSIRKSVVSAISQIITSNTLSDFTLRAELTDAITILANGKALGEIKFGESVQEHVRQQHLFMDDVVAEATVQMLADAINDRKTSFLKKVLSLYDRDAVESANGQMSLLTGDVPGREAILRNILEYLGYDTRIIYDTSERAAEQREPAEPAEPSAGPVAQAETKQDASPVQGDEGGQVTQYDREEVAARLEEGNVGEFQLTEYMTDDEVAEFMRLWNAFQPFNDALGEGYSRLDADLHSKDKKVVKAAQDEINRLEQAQIDAFGPVQEFVDGLIEKYDLYQEPYNRELDEEPDEESFDEDEFEDDGYTPVDEDEEPKPKKGKKGAKKGKEKKAEAKPYVVVGGASEATIAKQTYTQEEYEEFIYGHSTFSIFESKKTGERVQVYMVDDTHPIYHDHSVIVSRRLPGPNGKMSENGIYTGPQTETRTTTDYIIKYLKANKFKCIDEKKSHKNKYGFWVNPHNVIMNPIRIELPSVHKGWANSQSASLAQNDKGKWVIGASFGTTTGGASSPVTNERREGFDSKTDAVKKLIELAEGFLKDRFKGEKSKSYDQRDLENLIRALKTKTLPQAMLEEGVVDDVMRIDLSDVGIEGTQGDLFGGEVVEEPVAVAPAAKEKPKKESTGKKKTSKRKVEPGVNLFGEEVVEAPEETDEESEPKFTIEDEEGTAGNFHWIEDRICTNPQIITIPGADRLASVPKVALAEKDGKWYQTTYVTADGNGKSAWGSVIPTFKSSFLPFDSREDALKKAVNYMRWLLDNPGRKSAVYGETFNETKGLIDYIVKMELPKEEAKKQESTDDALANIKKALDTFASNGNYARVVRTLEAYKDFFGEDVAQEIGTILTDMRKDGISKESKNDMVRRAAELYNGLVAPETEDETPQEPVAPAEDRQKDEEVSKRIADILSGKDKNDYSHAMYNHEPGAEYPDKYYDEVVRQWDEYKNDISNRRVPLQKRTAEIVDETRKAAEKEYTDYKKAKGETVDEVGLYNATVDITDRELKKNQEYKELTAKIDELDKLVSPEAKDKFRRNAIGMLYTDYAKKAEEKEATVSKPATPAYGSQNTIVTTEKYEELKKRMMEKLGQLNAGFDPEVFFIGAQMAAYHVEAGARKFVDFAQRMIADLGDAIRPYLKAIYNGARDLPGMEGFKPEMDSAAEVEGIDVDSVGIEQPVAEEKPAPVEEPQPVAETPKQAAVQQVDVNALFGAINDMARGKREEVKLSDFAEPVESETAEPAQQETETAPATAETETLGELGKYTHTKTGKEMTIVRLTGDRLTNDEFKQLKARAKELGGYYSSYGGAKGFLFDDEADAIKFNTINAPQNAEEQTDDETAADTTAIVSQAASVAIEAQSLAEAESADEQATAEVITRIDDALDAIDDQLALLGYYEADQSGPFHESYGYMKSAEKKAVKDADKLAKRLAQDLGIDVGRKQLAKANIAPAGGEVTFRLPLNDGRELYVCIDMVPDSEDNLFIGGVMGRKMSIMYRVEQPSASGSDKYGSNNFAPYNVKYADLLKRIRSIARDYLPETSAPAVQEGPVDVLQVAKEQAEKNRKSKKDSVSSQQEGDAALGGLFADLYDAQDDEPVEEVNGPAPVERVKPTEMNGFKIGEKVQYTPSQGDRKPQTATIFDFEYDGRPVLDAGLAPILYEVVDWNQVSKIEVQEPVNDTQNGSSEQPQGVSADAGGPGEEAGQEGVRADRGGEGGREGDLHGSSRTLRPRYDDSVKRNTRNNRVAKGEVVYPKTPAARYKANIAAIRLMKELQDSGKTATKEQMAVLRQFTGWGGLGGYFNNEYSPEYRELKSLLSDEEMQMAANSINTAYYTPVEVIDAMWDIAKRLGFEGGNVLEGSAGIGNIIASMPKSMSERSEITAVELDQTTGGILSLLYPDANVMVKGFQDADIANGSVDLAITNVPFGNDIKVYDAKEKDISRKFGGGRIHDFCIAKNVRKLAPGGLGIFISTRGTLDSSSKALRQWLVNEGDADVIGAFRLNNATFEGTGATSDIIVVRKRVDGKVSPNAIDVTDTVISRREDYELDKREWNPKTRAYEIVTGKAAMEINSYFAEHPENMGGEMGFGFEHDDTYRPASSALWPTDKIDQNKRLAKWVKQFSSMQAEEQAVRTETQTEAVEDSNATKEGQLVTNSKGDICVSRNGKAVPIGVNSQKVKGFSKAQVLKDYDALKTAINEVLDYQLKNESDAGLKPLLDKLNRAYDNFARRYSRLNRNTAISFLRNDVDFPSIAAVEDYREKKSIDGKVKIEVKKTSIFSGRVLGAKRVPTPKDAKDGVIVSINQFGRIDIPFIANALNKDEDVVRQEILSTGLGFENPLTGGVEVEYEYLSGNVREKLEYAREHNTDGKYDSNIKALEKVVPADIPAHLIEFSLGSDWMPVELYTEYAKEKFGVNDNFKPFQLGGSWAISDNEWDMNVRTEQNRAAGVRSDILNIDKRGHELMIAAMNNASVVFSRTSKDPFTGQSVTETDKEATQAATVKMSEMRDDFKEWCRAKMLEKPELAERIGKVYNDTFNAVVPKEIRETFVPAHFEGMATKLNNGKELHLRLHQSKAVIRGTTEPLMLAHEVGTGKTFTLIATAMEMRRLGTAKKPMIVVQNATLGQFVSSAKELYPNAKILTISEADRTVEGRSAFYAKIKYNDWDMVVVPQSVFEMIPDSEERQRAFIQEKIDEKKFILEQAKQAGNSTAERQLKKELEDLEYEYQFGEKPPKKGKKDAKKEAKALDNAVAKAKRQLDRKTDDVSNFDDMGIDALLVDEAHSYKHLGFSTAMQRGVKGVDATGSKKSAGVYLKTRAVFDKAGWKNVVFATGTPISNTAAEIWTFMKYLMPDDIMRQNHIYYFDDFVRNFGNISQSLEFTTSGKFKENTRFASYTNLPELIRIWWSVCDTVRAEDAVAEGGEKLEDKQPKMENWTDADGNEHVNQARDIYLPQSGSLVDIMNAVRAKLEWYEGLSGKEKKENSHIPLTMFGIAKMAAIDPRLVDREAPDEPNSKTNQAVTETLKALKDSERYKGTAALFCDNFRRWDYDTNSGRRVEGFNIFEEIKRKLMDAGVPEDQIVIMKSGMNTAAKEKIFARVNSGEVRVIMGTTATLGTGVNIQERLFFEAHLDAPNRPMDYTQRNGRILRQGNLHKEWGIPVRVVRFGVEDSLDVTAYQRLSTKSKFINSIMDGKPLLANGMDNRVLEEAEEGEFDNPVAVLSGSQYALLKSQAERELRKLRNKKEQHRQDQIYIERTLKENGLRIDYDNQLIDEAKRNLEKVKAAFPDGTVKQIVIEGRKVSGLAQVAEAVKEKITDPLRAQIERRRNDNGFTTEDKHYTMTFDGVPVDIKVSIDRTREYDEKTYSYKTVMRTRIEYSGPSVGIDAHYIMGGMNSIKDIPQEFAGLFATGRYFTQAISNLEGTIARLNSDNELMMKRRGQPFADEDKLQKQEEIVKDYTEKMKAEMAEKEAKYAELAKNSTSSFSVDAVEVDEEEDGETSAEYMDTEGNGFFSGIEDRRENEGAYDFAKRVVGSVLEKYPALKGTLITTDSALKLSEEKQARVSNGLYNRKTKKILIFAKENIDSADAIERTIFHEAIHMAIDKLGWNDDWKLINLFNYALVGSGYYSVDEYREVFSDLKARYEELGGKKYSDKAIREEMLTHEMSQFMESGIMGNFLDEVRDNIPELAEGIDKVLNEIGYEPEKESERFDEELYDEFRSDRIRGAQRRNAERRAVGDSGTGQVLRDGRTPAGRGDEGTVSDNAGEGGDLEEDSVSYEFVTDPATIERLESGDKETGYRNVVLNKDGSLGSPMAGKLGRKGRKSVPTSPFTFDRWEQAEENPDMATEDGKINLGKPDKLGSVDGVDYNPYIHIRPSLINRQFTGAWKRKNLVFIETLYPTSELTSGYHAEKAVKSVGRHAWNGGDLILSRWDKPVRIVPWETVADDWQKEFAATGVTFDIVPPGLLDILASRGVEILPPKKAAGAPARRAYNEWRDNNPSGPGRGRNRVAYHGSIADFEAFDINHSGEGEGYASHGFGHYVALNRGVSVGYAWSNAFDYADRNGLISPEVADILRNDEFENDDELVARYDELLRGRQASAAAELEQAKREDADDTKLINGLQEEYDRWMGFRPLEDVFRGLRNIYTVEIPEDTGDNYIDEMKTLSKDGRRRIAEVVRNLPESELVRTLHGPNWLPQGFKTLANVIEREQYAALEIRRRLVDALGSEKAASKVMHDAGFVGITYEGRVDGPCVVIFSNDDLRIVGHDRFRTAGVEMFISNAESAVNSIQMEKATPQQWLKMIESKGGLKAGEDKWIGLSDWLKASDRKTLTKQEVLDYIAQNRIQIEEQDYAQDVDVTKLMEEDVREQIGRGKSLEELQAEVNELMESDEYKELEDKDEQEYWLRNKMIDRYGDDFDIGYAIFDGRIDYNIDPYGIEEDEFFRDYNGTRKINGMRLSYTTHGLDNKREIALTVPTIQPWNEGDTIHFGDAGEGRAIAWVRFGDAVSLNTEKAMDEDERYNLGKRLRQAIQARDEAIYALDNQKLLGKRFDEVNEKLANAYLTISNLSQEYGLPRGKEYNRVLVIDEIQSKRHQEARDVFERRMIGKYGDDWKEKATQEEKERGGYKRELTEAEEQELYNLQGEYKSLTEPMREKYGAGIFNPGNWRGWPEVTEEDRETMRRSEEVRQRIMDLQRTRVGIEAAPFEKNWHELAMKRMLRLAAEEGYDYLAWTGGEQQARRYSLGKALSYITRNEDSDGYKEFELAFTGGDLSEVLRVDDNGKIAYSKSSEFDGQTLDAVVGKEMAVRMMKLDVDDDIDGDNLLVGGEGMKGFYDEILPRFMNKYGKKWGVKVEDIYLPNVETDARTMHAVRITPEMRESVMQGQLMFRSGEQSEPSPVAYNESTGAKRLSASETARKFGVDIEFRPSSQMMFNGKPLAGRWMDGKMYVCLDHCRDNDDAVRTVLHEGVGHNGLRRLIGNENMREFCLDLFRSLPKAVRNKIANDAVTKYGGNIVESVERFTANDVIREVGKEAMFESTEEWLAETSETIDYDEYRRNVWDIIRDALRRVLAKVGINVPLSMRDVKWLMVQSAMANHETDPLVEARRQVVANALGFTLKQQAEKYAAVQLARNKIADQTLAPAARIYNKDVLYWLNRLRETWTDKDNAVHQLVNAIEKATGKAAKSFEDVRLALNQQSSKGLAAIEKFEREYWVPMQAAIRSLMDERGCDLHDIERYVMIKHGLERNEVFAKRDAREFYRDIHDNAVKAIENSDKIDDLTKKVLIAKEDAKLDKHLAAIDAGSDVKYLELRKQDYGGLTAMYSEYDPIEPFMEGVESEEEYQARVLQARHPKFTYMDENGQEQVDMAATEDAAQKEVNEFENGHDEAVKELWKRINGATKHTLKHQYDANMMSREQYNAVSGMFKYYVPLRGFADNTAEDMYDYYQSDQRNDFTPPLLKAKGRKTEAESPFGYIGSMASSGIAADMKNETKLALYYFVSNRADNDLVTISEVWYKNTGVDEFGRRIFTPVYPPFKEDLSGEDAKRAYDDWEKQMQDEAKAGFAFKGGRKLNLKGSVIHIDDSQKTSHIIKFKVGGRDMMMYINGNPRAAQAINNELNVEMSTDYQKVFGKVLRWFSGINTSYNPEFWLSNAQRDALFALMSVNVKEDDEYNEAFRKNFGSLLLRTITPGAKGGAYSLKKKLDNGELGDERLDRLYKEFVENGGVTGYTTLKNNEEWELELRKYTGDQKKAMQAVKGAFEKVQAFGEAIEQMTRFAAFMTSRESGKDIKESVNDAKELTVNFNRKGSGKAISFKEAGRLRTKDGKKLTPLQKAFVVGASWLPVYGRRFIMFFNASTQGLNAMYRLFKKNPSKMGLWTAGYLALGVVQAVLHALLDDDDDYLDIPDYERRNNLLLGGGGTYFKWALPQEARVFYAMGDMIVNHAMGREPHRSILTEVLASVSDIAPLNPAGGISAIAPSAVVPIVEVALNRDYKGSKIFNDLRYLSDEERKRTPKFQTAYQGTGRVYVLLSQFANWLSGGDYADAGWLNINPAAVEHILQGATGGAGTTLGKFYRGTVGQVLGEDFSVRNTPFLSRILTVNDERYRNVHTTELFDYYKAEAEHTKKLINTYRKNGDDDKLDRIFESEDYEIMNIYDSYRSLLNYFNDELKVTTDRKDRKALMKEQDAVRKEMIQEISNIK